MRGYERVEEHKTAGDVASGLSCNIWARAQFPAKLSYQVMSGHSIPVPGSRRGISVLRIDVLKWKPGRNTPKPAVRAEHPILDELGPKIVHFLVDYHADWFPSLGLPPSTGRHDQLDAAQIDSVLDRLEPVNQLLGEIQLFSGVKIGHSEYQGCQIVHSTPFKSSHQCQRMVRT